ncbi:Hypothetical protein NTJ_09131 [Nesidiocoris tenuis]|uniref:Uncharacterized protein n=1 Tax=Nesidiocoris tenuis TaxID=355587 RepID=A0ABN7AVU8_9HEMI|nr:Hypothetical protein NTJ_09131 [Nesidiocoris tenuis]
MDPIVELCNEGGMGDDGMSNRPGFLGNARPQIRLACDLLNSHHWRKGNYASPGVCCLRDLLLHYSTNYHFPCSHTLPQRSLSELYTLHIP